MKFSLFKKISFWISKYIRITDVKKFKIRDFDFILQRLENIPANS